MDEIVLHPLLLRFMLSMLLGVAGFYTGWAIKRLCRFLGLCDGGRQR